MEDWRNDRFASALNGTNPTVLVWMKSGFAIIGDLQFLPGYCLLMAYPRVPGLNDLSIQQRTDFLIDLSLLGDVVLDVCRPLKVNYEILINSADFLHAHVFPRYDWEPEERRKMPVWLYPEEHRYNPETLYSEEKYGDLKRRIAQRLRELMAQNHREGQPRNNNDLT